MLLEENQIAFHSDDGMMVDSVKDHSHLIAEMIGLRSDAEFLQAGVSKSWLFFPLTYCLVLLFINLLVF